MANDLMLLGAALPKLATVEELPLISNHAEALGALYVIEGSTLGGQIITQMITKQLGINEGLTFFYGYGDQTRQCGKNSSRY